MDIYTVTYFRSNYGSALQAYALQQKFVEFGVNAKIVEQPMNGKKIQYSLYERVRAFLTPEKHYGIKEKLRRIIENRIFKEKEIKINRFVKQNIKTISYENFCSELEDGAILLSGSDQIWSIINGNIKDFYLFKSISNKNVFKVSYAASIGITDLSGEQLEYYKNALKDYDIVSLRERAAFDQLKKELDNTIVRQDIDPTLLYEGTFWKKIVGKRIIGEKYVFVYMLRPDKNLIFMAKKIARIKHLSVIYMGQFNDFYPGVKTITDAGIEDFLSAIYYADSIITNSFHGTAFSVLFEKNSCQSKLSQHHQGLTIFCQSLV